jgi:biopolymer transport protein ExbB/TolQ
MDLIAKTIGILGAVFGVLFYTYRQGKQTAKSEQNEKIIENVKQVKKRKSKRANDSIDVVKQRLHSDARK